MLHRFQDRFGVIGLGLPVGAVVLALGGWFQVVNQGEGTEPEFAVASSEPLTTTSSLLDAWWASPLHKEALTWPTSTRAGGALVYWSSGWVGATAAIKIDY